MPCSELLEVAARTGSHWTGSGRTRSVSCLAQLRASRSAPARCWSPRCPGSTRNMKKLRVIDDEDRDDRERDPLDQVVQPRIMTPRSAAWPPAPRSGEDRRARSDDLRGLVDHLERGDQRRLDVVARWCSSRRAGRARRHSRATASWSSGRVACVAPVADELDRGERADRPGRRRPPRTRSTSAPNAARERSSIARHVVEHAGRWQLVEHGQRGRAAGRQPGPGAAGRTRRRSRRAPARSRAPRRSASRRRPAPCPGRSGRARTPSRSTARNVRTGPPEAGLDLVGAQQPAVLVAQRGQRREERRRRSTTTARAEHRLDQTPATSAGSIAWNSRWSRR